MKSGTLTGWIKNKDFIMLQASEERTKRLKGNKRSRSLYPLMEVELYRLFLTRRSKGVKVSSFWVKAMAMKLVRDLYPDTAKSFKASNNWRVSEPFIPKPSNQRLTLSPWPLTLNPDNHYSQTQTPR